jgi:endonuclease YncB( thermonuclease family)
MSRKRMLRRTVAGMVAVLVVSGNVLIPAQTAKVLAPTAIVADASYVTKGNYTWDASTGTLTITGTVNMENNASNDVDEVLTAYDHKSWGIRQDEVDKTKVKHLVIASSAVLPENCQAMFKGYSNLEDVVFAEYVDGKNIRKMSAMFQNCSKLTSVDMSGLINTENLQYIDNIFDGCSSLTSLDISNISGEKICQGRWSAGGGAIHPAIDAIKEAVKNCNSLEDFSISNEFLYNAVENAKANPNNSSNQNVTIDDVLDSLLEGNPNAESFKQQLLESYNEWFNNTHRTDIRTLTVNGAEGKAYDGAPLSLSIDGLTEGTDYKLTIKRDGLEAVSSAKDAGTYSYTIEGIGDYREKITGNVTISQRTAELFWSNLEFTYVDKNTKFCPTATVGNLVEGDECTVTVSGASAQAGTHEARATALSNANYALPSDATHSFTIYKKALTGVTATDYEGVYDGASHGITVSSTENGVEITYGLNTNVDAYTTEQPELKDAGTYTVYYRAKKENYTEVTGSATVTISPKEAGVEWGDVASFVYNGSAQAPTATATGLIEGDESEVVIEGAGTDVGNYTATATGFTNTNYTLPEASTQAFEITPADQEGITAEGYTGEYDGQAHTIKVNAPDGATVTYSETEDGEYTAEAPSLKDAGTKTVYYKVTNAPNYNDASGSAVITVTAKEAAITWGETEFDYDGETHCPTAELSGIIEGDDTGLSVSGASSEAGTHTATASIDNTNYVLTGELTTEFTIKAADMTVTAEDVTVTYDNQPHTITVNAPEGATILYSETEDGEYTAEAPSVTAAGSKTVYYKVSKANFNDVTGSAKVTVEERVAQLAWGDTLFTYDGSEKLPAASVANIAEGDTCEVTVEGGATDVGDYTATAVSLSNANYVLPDDATKAFSIKAAELNVTAAGFNGPYDKEAHSIKVTAPEGATVTYSYNGGEYTEENPSFTEFGFYTVNFRVEKPNFETFEGSADVEITKADLSLSVSIDDWTYGETAKTPSVTGNEGLDYTIEYSKDGETWSETVPGNAGNYTVKVTVPESVNYQPAVATDTFTIEKADLNLSVSIDDWTYGEAAKTPVVTGNDGQSYTVEYSADEENWSETVPENAGNYTVKVTVPESVNYQPAVATDTFTIEKAYEETTISLDDWTYGETAKTPVVTGTEGRDYVIRYSADDGETWSETVPENAGQYIVSVTLIEDANHDESYAEDDFEIHKATATAEVYIDDWKYGEDAKEPVIEITPGDLDYTVDYYTIEGVKVDNPVDAGKYTVAVTVPETQNYTYALAEAGFTINKADVSISVSVEDWTYGEAAKEPVIKITPEGLDYTVEYFNAEGYAVDNPVDAGDYFIRVTVAESANYNGNVEGDEFSILSGKLSVTAEGFEGEYDGQEHGLTFKGLPEGAVVEYAVEDGEYTSEAPSFKDAGTYVVNYKITAPNYEVLEGSAEIDIDQRTAVLEWTPESFDYDGQPHCPTATVKNLVDGDTCTVEVGGNYMTAAGGYYNATAISLSNDNYKLPEEGSEFQWSIEPGRMTVSADDITVDYDPDKSYSITVIASEPDVTIQYRLAEESELSSENPSFTDAGTYQVIYEVSKENYVSADGSAFITINKVAREFSVSLDDWTYGTDAKTPVLTGAENATYEYSVKGSDEWTTEVPVNAGDYVVRATAAGNNNYYESVAEDEFSIIKADRQISVTIANWLEGEEPNAPELTGADSATFEYKEDGGDWTTEVPTTVGAYTVRATVAGDDNYNEATAEARFVISEAHLLKGNTVSFKDYISLNFLAEISSSIVDGSYVVFTYDHYGETVTKRVDVDENDMHGKYYRFRCPLTASEMAVEVTADLYIAGSTEPVSTFSRNIRDFSLRAIEDNGSDKDVIVAALNYGGYTQEFFNKNTDVIANEGLETDLSDVTVTSEVNFVRPEGYIDGISYVGASLLLKQAPYIRYYFKLDSGSSVEDYTFKLNGEEVTATAKGTMFYIDSAAENASELDKAQTVTVEKDGEAVFSFDYSVIKWAEAAANDPADEAELNMAKGLYAYYKAASAYVGG